MRLWTTRNRQSRNRFLEVASNKNVFFCRLNGVYLWRKQKKSIVRLFCDVVRRGRGASFTILLLDLRSDAHDSFQFDRRRELWSRSKNLWMTLPNAAAKLLTAGCADPTRLQPLSVWQDHVTINVTTRDTWNLLRNWGLSEPVVHLIRRLITDASAAWSRSTFLTSVFYQLSPSSNIY